MNIYEKLAEVQANLTVLKTQTNAFGKYKYRSLEDIETAVKPLLKLHKLALVINDLPIEIGGRIYIRATATLIDTAKPDSFIENIAFAREALTKKGMDESQITGSTSSYARKYCLNGLFLIDDTADADTMDNSKIGKSPTKNDSFLDTMKGFATNNPTAYKKVLDYWQTSSAKNIKNPESQVEIVKAIEKEIGGTP